jgi:hypothetical protein
MNSEKKYIKSIKMVVLMFVMALAFSPISALNAWALTADNYESNNTREEAKPISVGAAISANLVADNTFGSTANDYYKFTVAKAAPYTVEFDHAVPGGATNAYFAYVRISDGNDTAKTTSYTKLNAAKTYVTADWLAVGTYYVEVTAYSSDAGLNAAYTFVVKQGGHIDNAYYAIRSVYSGKTINPFLSAYSQSTKLTYGTDYTVTGTRKAIGLGKATVTGKGNFYGSHTVDFAIYPNRVMLKSVKALGNKKVKVEWYKVKSVYKYVVQYKLTSSKKWKSKTASKSKSSLTLKKLKKGKKYNVRIYAYKKSGGKKFCSINTDSSVTKAYTATPGFASYSKKNVKVK